jgi:hypothetical protein
LCQFYGNVALSLKTNTNIFDSVAFFEKFLELGGRTEEDLAKISGSL